MLQLVHVQVVLEYCHYHCIGHNCDAAIVMVMMMIIVIMISTLLSLVPFPALQGPFGLRRLPQNCMPAEGLKHAFGLVRCRSVFIWRYVQTAIWCLWKIVTATELYPWQKSDVTTTGIMSSPGSTLGLPQAS